MPRRRGNTSPRLESGKKFTSEDANRSTISNKSKARLGNYLVGRSHSPTTSKATGKRRERDKDSFSTPQWFEDKPPPEPEAPNTELIAQSLHSLIMTRRHQAIPISMNMNVSRVISAWYETKEENDMLRQKLEAALEEQPRRYSNASSGWTSAPDEVQPSSPSLAADRPQAAVRPDCFASKFQEEHDNGNQSTPIQGGLSKFPHFASVHTRIRSPSRLERDLSQELKLVGGATKLPIGKPPQKEGPPKAFSRESARHVWRFGRRPKKEKRDKSTTVSSSSTTASSEQPLDDDDSSMMAVADIADGDKPPSFPAMAADAASEALQAVSDMAQTLSRRNGRPVEEMLQEVSNFFYAHVPHHQHRFSSALFSIEMAKARREHAGQRQRSDGDLIHRLTTAQSPQPAPLQPPPNAPSTERYPRQFSFDYGQDRITRPSTASNQQERHVAAAAAAAAASAALLSSSPSGPMLYDPNYYSNAPLRPDSQSHKRVPGPPSTTGVHALRHDRNSSNSSANTVVQRSPAHSTRQQQQQRQQQQPTPGTRSDFAPRSSVISTQTTDSDSSRVTAIYHGQPQHSRGLSNTIIPRSSTSGATGTVPKRAASTSLASVDAGACPAVDEGPEQRTRPAPPLSQARLKHFASSPSLATALCLSETSLLTATDRVSEQTLRQTMRQHCPARAAIRQMKSSDKQRQEEDERANE